MARKIPVVLIVAAIAFGCALVLPIYWRHHVVQQCLSRAAHYAATEPDNKGVTHYFVQQLAAEGVKDKIQDSMLRIDLETRVDVARTPERVEVRFNYFEMLEVPFLGIYRQYAFDDLAGWDIN